MRWSRPVIRQGATSHDCGENCPTKLYMFYVYILLEKNGQLYTGFSADLKLRIKEHNSGKVESTKNRRPLKLIHYEAYYLESDARRREKYLKTTEGKRFLKQQIRDLLIKLKDYPRHLMGFVNEEEGGQDGNALVSKTSGSNP